VQRILDLTESVRDVYFELQPGSDFQFHAGQFVMLHVPAEPKPVLRAYSIASADTDKTGFRLLFKFVAGGIASDFIWKWQEQQVLQFTGPFGRVLFQEPVPTQVVFLSTGTGLAPHLSYLISKLDLLKQTKCFVFFGVTNESEIFCEKELIALKSQIPHLHYEIVLSRPSLHWTGKRGYVQDQLIHTHYTTIPTDFYLCGNGQMIKETREMLEKNGVSPDKIHSEAFF
jgi:ferredoxin-NADP reductase